MSIIFVVLFFFPFLLLITGFVLKNKHSQYPDLTTGYHVGKLATKNEEMWEEANRYSGKQFLIHGIIVFLLDVVVMVYSINTIREPLEDSMWWVIFIIVYTVLTCIIPTITAILFTHLHLKRYQKDKD